MNDKKLGNKHLINLHGIRFHITGDPTSQEARRRIHLAKLDVAELKKTHPGLSIARLERPGLYEIKSMHGIDQVSMTIPEVVEKVEKKKFRKVKEEGYIFVPAIVIATEDDAGGWEKLADISLCASAKDWTGSIVVVKDISMPWAQEDLPGCTYNQEGLEEEENAWIDIIPGTLAVRGLTNWGNKQIYGDYDWDDGAQSETDTGFVPGPAGGPPVNPYSGPAYDDMWQALIAFGYGIQLGFFVGSGEADRLECHACRYDSVCPDNCWDCREWHFQDGYWYDFCCAHPTPDFPCYFRNYTDTALAAWFSNRSYSYLWYAYYVIAWQEQWYHPDQWAYMGFCYSGDVHILENIPKEGIKIVDEEKGGPNTRFVTRTWEQDYWGVVYHLRGEDFSDLRSGGDIPDWYWDEHGNLELDTEDLTMQSMCARTHCSTYSFREIYPWSGFSYSGAFIQDLGNEEHVCPVADFKNLYFVLTQEYHKYHDANACDHNWHVSDVGYYSGFWSDGRVATCGSSPSQPWVDTRYEQFYVLVIILNGERIEIDRTDDYGGPMSYRRDEFDGLESLILDFLGKPVYMYSYARYKVPEGQRQCMYVRYGYFIEESGVMKHYQSQKYEPAGVVKYGRLQEMHDVAGSIERDGKYGYGQCAGFIVKNTFEREIPV